MSDAQGRGFGKISTMSAVATTICGLWVGAYFGRNSQQSAIAIVEASAPALAASTAGPIDANIYVNLAKRVVPSVVNISTLSSVKSPYYRGGPDDLFRRFFEDYFQRRGGPRGGPDSGDDEEDESEEPRRGGPPRATSLGTGFIIESGLILTNNHVVADAEEIRIQFTEDEAEEPTEGEVVGRDPELDLALIRVKSKRVMVPLPLGDSDAVEVGEYVAAVGNPFGQGHSVTHGIISAKGRKSPDFALANYLQTDAPINPGNSGGPLVNLRGEVVGINNAIDQRAQGIGFAIPISIVKKVLPQLKSKGTVSRGYIGVLVGELTPELAAKLNVPKDLKAPFVTHVNPGEPAEKAGVKPYDVIQEVNGKNVRTSQDLIHIVTSVSVGESLSLKVLRQGKPKTLSVTVAQRPASGPNRPGPGGGGKQKGQPGEDKNRQDVGMTLEDLTPEIARELGLPTTGKLEGVVVEAVAYGGPADQAGLIRGDVILEVDTKRVKDASAFYSLVKGKKTYMLRVRRLDAQGREAFSVILLNLGKK